MISHDLIDRFVEDCHLRDDYEWVENGKYFGSKIERCYNGPQARMLYRALVNDMRLDDQMHTRYVYSDNLAGIKAMVKKCKKYADKLLYGKE